MDEQEERRGKNGDNDALRKLMDLLEENELPFGVITQYGYRDLEQRFHRWFIIGLIAFTLIGLSTSAGLVGFAYVLNKVQENREEFIHSNCEATNARNKDTVDKLTELSNEAANKTTSEAEKKRIEQSLPGTIALINALSPVQNCDTLVKVASGEAEAPPPTPQPKKRKESR